MVKYLIELHRGTKEKLYSLEINKVFILNLLKEMGGMMNSSVNHRNISQSRASVSSYVYGRGQTACVILPYYPVAASQVETLFRFISLQDIHIMGLFMFVDKMDKI